MLQLSNSNTLFDFTSYKTKKKKYLFPNILEIKYRFAPNI